MISLLHLLNETGQSVIIYGGGGGGGAGVTPKSNVFLGKHFVDPTLKIQMLNQKRYHPVITHVLYHFCAIFVQFSAV